VRRGGEVQEGSNPGRGGCTSPLAGGGGCAAAPAAHCPSLSLPPLPLSLLEGAHLRIAPAQSECSPKRQSRPGTKSSSGLEPSCPVITAAWVIPIDDEWSAGAETHPLSGKCKKAPCCAVAQQACET
jgi:hypothetical protein